MKETVIKKTTHKRPDICVSYTSKTQPAALGKDETASVWARCRWGMIQENLFLFLKSHETHKTYNGLKQHQPYHQKLWHWEINLCITISSMLLLKKKKKKKQKKHQPYTFKVPPGSDPWLQNVWLNLHPAEPVTSMTALFLLHIRSKTSILF